MEFKTTSYTSPLFWHFVRGHGDESLKLFLKEEKDTPIFSDGGSGVLLSVPPGKRLYHPHDFVLENAAGSYGGSNSNADEASLAADTVFILHEPRSICFADIPISHLPIHINRYFGIGLGFRRDKVIMNREDFKPVEYYPRNNLFALKDACIDFNETSRTPHDLRKYAKVPSKNESFQEIYHEREWRTFESFHFTSTELALIFFPTREILNKALKESRFQEFFKKGVGYICGEDLYDSTEEKVG